MSGFPPPAVLALPAAVVGLVMGSFVTALSYRQPRAQSVAAGRSKCPACGHTLAAADLVPLFSWFANRGACRYCRAPISRRYPAIEFSMMILFTTGALIVTDPLRLGLLAAMTLVAVTLAVIDLEQGRLPDGFVFSVFVLALAWRWTGDHSFFPGIIAGAAVLALALLLSIGFKAITGQGGLGLGDAKLMAAASVALPTGPLLLFLTLAGIFGVGFGLMWRLRSRERRFPFGPAILTAYWLSLAAGNTAFAALVSYLQQMPSSY